MSIRKLSYYSLIVLSITACKTTKTNTVASGDKSITIPLDTINVVSAKREIYRASNTRLTDIIHTKLEVEFDWTLCRMSGHATIEAKPYFYPTSKLYLNARGMDIKNVKVLESDMQPVKSLPKDGISPSDVELYSGPMSYKYENDSLKINLGRVFTAEEKYVVIIDYVAKPNELKASGGSAAITDDKGLYFINPTGENPFKLPQIWTQGETQSNSVWFPTIDSPNEKMTQEILMKVDDKYITLSNGALISSVKQPDGKRIDHWKLDQPHSPYLAMMAVGEFKKVTDAPWNGKEISYYVDPRYEPYAKEIFGDTKEMVDFYSDVLGVPYAWPKYAQIAVNDYVSGSMENTSNTLHGDFMVYQTPREMQDQKKGTAVIAHELFHQWFGDLATCESWSNLSLNESFATYGEYLWEEHKNGRMAADYHHAQSRQGYLHSTKEVDLIRFYYNDKEDMFDATSYNKGGQILHMLRKAVGDAAFFASLKNYLETNKYKSAEVHNLRLAFEETTGRDMNWFFNQWYLNKGRPSLKITKKNTMRDDSIALEIEQTQDLKKYPLYTLPLEIDIYTKEARFRRHFELTEQKQTFSFKGNSLALLVNIDAERQLLADIDYPKTVQEYIFQYRSCPLYDDKMEALKGLEPNIKEPEVFNHFSYVAEKEPFFVLRRYVIQQLEKAYMDNPDAVKTLFMRLYLVEKNNLVRAKLLESLNKLYPGTQEMKGLNLTALQDPSYAVCSEALNSLYKADPVLAAEKAGLFERESGKDILFTIATIYSTNGGDGHIHFYHGALNYIRGFDLLGFSSLYAKAAKQCKNPENVINAAKDLELIGKGSHKYVKFATTKGIKDILNLWESKENSAQVKLDNAKKQNQPTAELEKELQAAVKIRTAVSDIYNRVK